MTFALYFGNRGFFPESLIAGARNEMKTAVEKAGFNALLLDEKATKFGAVETAEEGRTYANFLKENKGKYDGAIICLPNFGDENGAVPAFVDCDVPILIQAYPDEIGKMDFQRRRDAFCGKFSIMDMFCQFGIKFTIYEPHTVHPSSDAFTNQLKEFAAVCRVANSMKRFTVGAIGARTTAFKTVRYDELALQKYGITLEALDLTELLIRINKMSESDVKVKEKIERLVNYTDFSCCPKDKTLQLAKISVATDDMIKDYKMDCIAFRCWVEIEQLLGVAPCVLLSELNDRGIVTACEVDVLNAVAMYGLAAASQQAAICLDWNNNYGTDEDKCILFHCGPVAQQYMTGKGKVTDHKMFAKSFGEGCGWGVNEGRIAPFKMTFASSKTENGKLIFYTGEGEFTNDKFDDDFFGCGGVAKIDNLQQKLYTIGRNGYRHHVSATRGHYEMAVREAFKTYLGYEIIEL